MVLKATKRASETNDTFETLGKDMLCRHYLAKHGVYPEDVLDIDCETCLAKDECDV